MRWFVPSVVILLLAGCSSASEGNQPTGAVAATPPTHSARPAPAVPKTALAVIRALAKANPHVHLTVTYTARTDPNNLLGRPNGYVSKSAFNDDRVRPSDIVDTSKGSIDHGGGIEYFSTENGAMKRGRYLVALGTGGSAFGTSEYDYVDGGVLLRITESLVPSVAKRYKHQLETVMQHPAVGPLTAS